MSNEQQRELPDRIAELEARVNALKEQQSAQQTESNFDKARRLYPKGTKFKSAMDGYERVSN
jgi:predicted Zn-dependent protease